MQRMLELKRMLELSLNITMLIQCLLEIFYSQATGKKADQLLSERILKPIGVTDYKLWKDESGNVLTYCCVDMSARDYSKLDYFLQEMVLEW
jgi:CubicO group peptidase (beta-lactamase class C family)